MYTRCIGVLNEDLLDSKYSLSQARVLYELATRPEPKATAIAQDLGMDRGYLSRLLKEFERTSVLRRKISTRDGRVAELELTTRGKSAFRKLNALSENGARSMLQSQPPAARKELIRCMKSIESILTRTRLEPRAYTLRPHRVGDMGWVVHRESIGYAEQYGWDQGFEALVASIVSEFVTHFDPRRERCWIAEIEGQSVGHVFLVAHPTQPDTAKLRLLFVESGARGIGLGDALVRKSIRFARSAGYRRVVLWTQSILTAAHRIYERAGFHLVKAEAHHSFGHDLIGQEWGLDLA